jgi:hypothetical protein
MMTRVFVAIALVITVSGCSGTGTDPGSNVCNGSNIPQLSLTSPAPGASNVSDTMSALFLSGTLYSGSGSSVSIKLAAANGTASTLTTFNATSNGYSVPLPALSSATTYTVDYVITNSGATASCATESVTLGSFTTQ